MTEQRAIIKFSTKNGIIYSGINGNNTMSGTQVFSRAKMFESRPETVLEESHRHPRSSVTANYINAFSELIDGDLWLTFH